MAIVTLITDYGERDQYAGVLKGVLLCRGPGLTVVDITHDVAPFDVAHGAFVLRQIWSWYPPGTVHVVVVDPGVGSLRRILVGSYDDRYVVAPDNGLVTLVHQDLTCGALYALDAANNAVPDRPATFHGRDIMAPIAAEVALGKPISSFGTPISDPVQLEMATRPTVEKGGVSGGVLHVDRFGTLVTTIRRTDLQSLGGTDDNLVVTVDGTHVGGIKATFGDVGVGEPVAVFGGSGYLEIAVNQGSALQRFGRKADVVIRCG